MINPGAILEVVPAKLNSLNFPRKKASEGILYMANNIYFNRELSWLSFNYRILQEAKDEQVPLYDRIRFMALFASNLDSFYRSRVAALTNLTVLKSKTLKKINFNPTDLLQKINGKVDSQQEELFAVYQQIIHEALPKEHIYLIDETNLSLKQASFIKNFYKREVSYHIQPIILMRRKITFFLQNKALYLAIKLVSKTGQETNYALIKIPSPPLERFITLPEEKGKKCIIFIDDLLRYCLPGIFPGYTIESSYSVKLNRDADQYSEDEFRSDLIDKINRGLLKRKNEQPSHFLYDERMPKPFRKIIRDAFAFQKDELIAGGKYHNFNDFIDFPNLTGRNLTYQEIRALPVKVFDENKTLFQAIDQKDYLVYFPYHKYLYVLNFLNQAILTGATRAIYITLYRIGNNSKVISTLMTAARKGIPVTAFAEVNVSSDKESNSEWTKQLEKAGVRLFYSFPGLKVHAKLCLIEVSQNNTIHSYSYLSTGNFNEKLAKLNSDFGYFTANPDLNSEVKKVFNYLTHQNKPEKLNHLLAAPFNMRRKFYKLIDNEIIQAKEGKEASIFIKVNNLQDIKIIKKLYDASRAGVKIRIVVRSICCLVPGIKGMSENIEVISLIDRFSEHARIFKFNNGGDPLFYIGSADWMVRNFDRRIEIVFPVYESEIKAEVDTIIEMQWRDNVKARIIEKSSSNPYRRRIEGSPVFRAQADIFEYLKKFSQKTSVISSP
jgi:polyphosphate kinase